MTYKFDKKKDHLSNSSLKKFDDSPLEFVQYKTEHKPPSDAMLFGNLVDTMLFEPRQLIGRYFCDINIITQIGGTRPRSTNKYKEWVLTQSDDILIIAEEDKLLAQACVKALKTNIVSKEYLDRIKSDSKDVQIDMEFIHKGFKIKGRADAQIKQRGSVRYCLELKTGASAKPRKFARQFFDLGYHIQMGVYDTYYQQKFERPEFFCIVVETVKPFNVSVNRVSPLVLDYGRSEFNRLLDDFQRCIDQKLFDASYEFKSKNGFFNIELPGWL